MATVTIYSPDGRIVHQERSSGETKRKKNSFSIFRITVCLAAVGVFLALVLKVPMLSYWIFKPEVLGYFWLLPVDLTISVGVSYLGQSGSRSKKQVEYGEGLLSLANCGVVIAFLGFLVAALIEETIFRWGLLAFISIVFSIVCPVPVALIIGILVSQVCFGLAHKDGGWKKIILTTTSGLVLCAVALIGGLWAAVVLHALSNTILVCTVAYLINRQKK